MLKVGWPEPSAGHLVILNVKGDIINTLERSFFPPSPGLQIFSHTSRNVVAIYGGGAGTKRRSTFHTFHAVVET